MAGMRVQPEIRYLGVQVAERGSMGMNFKKKVETTKRMKDWMNYLTEGEKENWN